jgi:non-heme chloroperoxidase
LIRFVPIEQSSGGAAVAAHSFATSHAFDFGLLIGFREFSALVRSGRRGGGRFARISGASAMRDGHKATVDGAKAFLEADFAPDLLHGCDDQIVPLGASVLRSAELLRDADYKVYQCGASRHLSTLKDGVKADLLQCTTNGSSPD